MSYTRRRQSKPLEKLKFRVESLKSVKPDFDFGNGMTAGELEQFGSELEEKINSYNKTLADADTLKDQIQELEREANDISERLLAMVVGNYGRDSLEYQRMGGTRKSEIQHTGTRPETYDGNGDGESGTGTEPEAETSTTEPAPSNNSNP